MLQEDDKAIPILPSRSVRTIRWPFTGDWVLKGKIWGAPYFYAILTRGTIELHFFTHKELLPAESIAGCYIRVSDMDSLYQAFALAELPRTGIPRQDVLEDKPWGMREFAIVDPDGNLVRIGQTI